MGPGSSQTPIPPGILRGKTTESASEGAVGGETIPRRGDAAKTQRRPPSGRENTEWLPATVSRGSIGAALVDHTRPPVGENLRGGGTGIC
ncbi:hypothetical protein NDU88_002039 [Pleurodeles waltl]|uniref:Uncharacterized protein n=1 Tax=Pleurodeles waltl TaxID=8319 RepID=A0AAV7SDT2_PLEWA|nr:hypothetical protein NDU88_002039 [Pleurodeles waltl]